MEIRRKILTGYATLMLVLCIIILVLGVLWLNPATLSPPTSVPVEKPKTTQYLKAIQLTSGPWNDRVPVWSPDGKRIAVESDRFRNWSIWIINANGSNPVQLTSNKSISRWPTWSPDGKKIAFWSLSSGQADIWVIGVDRRNQTRVTNDSADKGPPHWSPDGKSLLFSKKQVSWDIWVSSMDGHEQIQLTKSSNDNIDPSWSPDGRRIVFASNRTGNFDIWIMNADGSNQTQLTTDVDDEIKPQISPDGENVLFMKAKVFYDTGWGAVIEMKPPLWVLWVMNINGQYPRAVMIYLQEDSNPSWSPDGRRIGFWRYINPIRVLGLGEPEDRSDAEVFIINAYGSDVIRPTSESMAQDMYPSWSPDGRRIVFASNRTGNYNIWVSAIE